MKFRTVIVLILVFSALFTGCKSKEKAKDKKMPCPNGMAHIPAGKFIMGCSEGDKGCEGHENPSHEVEISKGFCMDIYEVTQGAYESEMKKNPSYFKNCGDQCPVEQVLWQDAAKYCEKKGKRLPAEAEWEYAARAGTSDTVYAGNSTEFKCGSDTVLDKAGWFCGNNTVDYEGCVDSSGWGGSECSGTHPVGQKAANPWGLYDMHGNVWEWVGDWYGSTYYGESSNKDPRGPEDGDYHILRGGSWDKEGQWLRVSARTAQNPEQADSSMGFRCVKDF